MSFPNIPDIHPDIDITLEDAINLLLVSVALEEISLSDLIRAEAQKLENILKQCNSSENSPENILDINRSIDDTLKNIIKLQMILQFKLDNVRELIPTATTVSTTTASTTTTTCSKTTTTKSSTTSSHTTTCTMSTCSTTTKATCGCGATGKAMGRICNPCDRFDRQMAVLKLYAFNDDFANRSICYYIGGACSDFRMDAADGNIRMHCPCAQKAVLLGKGHIHTKTKGKPVIINCSFTLTIWLRYDETTVFRMEITSREEPELNHDSGLVTNKNDHSILFFWNR